MRRCLIGGLALVLASCSAAAEPGSSTSVALPSSSTTTPTPASSPPPTTTSSTTTPAAPSTTSTVPTPAKGVEIVGDTFLVDGEVTNEGGAAEGLLLNSRMVQAVIDIEGENAPFRYADTGRWDPDRNVDEFVAALPVYAAAGIDAVTINLQGGNPVDAPVDNRPAWRISAYGADGSIDPAWLGRLDRVLRTAGGEGLVVILGLFYFGQDHRLADEAAVIKSVDGVVDWLIANDHRNVLIEICNECNVNYDHAILRPDRVTELMKRVRDRSGGRLAVSASLTGGKVPDDSWIEASDFVLLHGNRQEASDIREMVSDVRGSSAYAANPKPILFNEDSTNLANLEAAVAAGAGWGYHDKAGFQVPPVTWAIDSPDKRAFFEAADGLGK